MRRAIVGNSVGIKSVMMLVLALVVLVGASPALALEQWTFRNMGIDYMKFGTSTNKDASGNAISVSALLVAEDADTDVWANGADGKVDTTKGDSQLLTKYLGHPIMANIERDEHLIMAAVIQGVTTDYVNILRNEEMGSTNNSVIRDILNAVTASFSPELFGENTPSSLYSNVHPTYATSTLDIQSIVGSPNYVIVYWDVPGLVVSATESIQSAKSLKATVSMIGGGSGRTGQSNFVGIETGYVSATNSSAPTFDVDYVNYSYPAYLATQQAWKDQLDEFGKGKVPGVSPGIRIVEAIDSDPMEILDPARYLGGTVPFQFRTKDQVVIQLAINVNEQLDGEPDEYFGIGGTDKLELDASGDGTGDFIGGKLAISGAKTSDLSSVFGSVAVDSASVSGTKQLVSVSATIADTVVTAGPYSEFMVKAVVSDEVSNSEFVETTHAVDTSAPMVTAITAEPEAPNSGNDIGVVNPDMNEAKFTVEVNGNGEDTTTTSVKQWLNVAFSAVGKDNAGNQRIWADDPAIDGIQNLTVDLNSVIDTANATASSEVRAASESALISNIPSGTVQGAKVSIWVKNNVSTTVVTGGIALVVTDDARNDAVVYPALEDVNPSNVLDTTSKWYSVSSFTTEGMSKLINPATIEVDNMDPVLASTTVAGQTAIKLDLAPGQIAYGNYIPAQYTAAGALLSATRITENTMLDASLTVFDDPDRSDDITMTVDLTSFGTKASKVTVVSPDASGYTAETYAANDKILKLSLHPSVSINGIVPVTLSIPVGIAKNSDLPNSVASLAVSVSDTVGNYVRDVPSRYSYEIDTSGPVVQQEKTFFVKSVDDVTALTSWDNVPTSSSVNASAGDWLVWAAVVKTDGIDEANFPLSTFKVNWDDVFNYDTNRLEDNTLMKGKKMLSGTATEGVFFVTNAIKIKDDANPRNAASVTYYLYDALGNLTSKKSASVIAISGQGPDVTEISLSVDGKSQAIEGITKLGIGNQGPDATNVSFEIYPGAQVIVEATLTTIDGRAPDTILLNASDLYPAGFKTMTDEIPPSYTKLTAQGTVYARWEYLAYNFSKLITRSSSVYYDSTLSNNLIFDQSNMNYLMGVLDYSVVSDQFTSNWPGRRFNGPIAGATPAQKIDMNSIALSTSSAKSKISLVGGPTGASVVSNDQEALRSIAGLPFIMVQRDATAKKSAQLTIYVWDKNSLFNYQTKNSSTFVVDSEPPRASIIYSPTFALNSKYRIASGPRIGFPTAPNGNTRDILVTPPRVRVDDQVGIVAKMTNATIDGKGNDAFRPLPGLLPSDLSTGFFKIDATNDASIKDVTVDLSMLSNLAGMKNVSVFDPNVPVPNPDYPNIVTIDSVGVNKPDQITAKYTVTVTNGVGTDAFTSKTPVDVTPTIVDDAGNKIVDTTYDKNVILTSSDSSVKNQPGVVLAVDNMGPYISGDVVAQILKGSAIATDAVTGVTKVLTDGDLVFDNAIVAPSTILRVTVTVVDQVDHPLDLVIDKNNFGPMNMRAVGLKLANSVLVSKDARLNEGNSSAISVPFEVTMPSKEIGLSTFAFQFVIQATDTVGNMSEKRSTTNFSFDGNPDAEYFDASGALVQLPYEVTVDASPVPQKIVTIHTWDVGGIKTIEWVPQADATISFSATDRNGNPVSDLILNADGSTEETFNLYVTIPYNATSTVFNASAIVTDVDGNVNQTNKVIVNVNQPPFIAAEIPYEATDTNTNQSIGTGFLSEITGIGYNAALADVREVTLSEGDKISLLVSADDVNVANTVTLSATGTAVTSENVLSAIKSLPAAKTGLMDFTFEPTYLAVTGSAKSATYYVDIQASDGSQIPPDSMRLVFNVIAKYATPIITIESVKVDNVDVVQGPVKQENIQTISLNEGSKIQIVVKGQDPGNEKLSYILETIPSTVSADIVTKAVSDNIVYGTMTYTASYFDADIPVVGYDSPVDPFWASFKISNASSDNRALIPVRIINVSQAPLITAMATINTESPVELQDKQQLVVQPGSTIVIDFKAEDSDGDAVLTTLEPVVTSATSFAVSYVPTMVDVSSFESQLTIIVPEKVSPEDATATVVYTAADNSGKTRSTTYTIVVYQEPIPPTPDYDELLVAQGPGADSLLNWKTIDPGVTEIDGRAVSQTSTYRSMFGATPAFLEKIGGGSGRALYVNTGDVDGDGVEDVVVSFGHVTADNAPYANIVVAKNGKTKELIGNSFVAFQSGEGNVNYNGGEIRVAVGNFIGSSTSDQIATAMGFGGKNIIRIYQYTGKPAPMGFEVVAQFNGLANSALTNNVNGGLTLAAGDLNGDGKDELIICQTNSESSRTQFTAVELNADGSIKSRVPGVAFSRKFQGNGGIEATVCDLDGDKVNEIVFASKGNTLDFTTDPERNEVPLNLISVVIPQLDGTTITSFKVATGGIRNIFPSAVNPSGSQTIATIEANGTNDGQELVAGTDSIYAIDGVTVTATIPAPIAKYTFFKLDFDGTTVSGVKPVLGQPAVGFNAFPTDLNPTSGAVNVAAGNID